jgi:hypothetical protein
MESFIITLLSLFALNVSGLMGNTMSGMQESLGDGHQQIVTGMIIFLVGAIWGGMEAGADMKAADVYWPAVVMLSGAMITLLGTTFGTGKEDDRSNDLLDAISEITGKLNELQEKIAGESDSAADDSGSSESEE